MDFDKPKFSSSEFIISPKGILKIVSIVLFIISSIIFLSVTNVCSGASWYTGLFAWTMAISGILVAILYTIFALGIVKRALATWNSVDMIFSSLDFVFTLVVSIATLAACSNRQAMDYVPPILAIVGSICLAVTATMDFIQWKSDRDEEEERQEEQQQQAQYPRPTVMYRKSVIA